jgi:hypothetical protein
LFRRGAVDATVCDGRHDEHQNAEAGATKVAPYDSSCPTYAASPYDSSCPTYVGPNFSSAGQNRGGPMHSPNLPSR